MRKLLNDPFAAVDEMIAGVLVAHGHALHATPSGRGLVVNARSDNRRVGVIVGGGSGHEPAFFGYLGRGLADGCAVGNVFASPSATPAVEIASELDRGAGVLFLFGNYEGDIMNFAMAAELLELEGIDSQTVLVTDDVASAPAGSESDRRGVAGDVIVFKAAGACAERGASLQTVADAAQHANAATRSLGVALGPCIVPTAGKPTFDLPEGEMDIGMGVHGEAGIRRTALAAADDVAEEIVARLLDDLGEQLGPLFVMVNTLGATPLLEGYVFLNAVERLLREADVAIHRALVGEYITSLEMAGLSLTLVNLDDELRSLLDAPAAPIAAPALTWS